MFALEIKFEENMAEPDMVLVRRPQFIVGASDRCHVEIEDLAELGYELLFSKDLGKGFKCKPLGVSDDVSIPDYLSGDYQTQAAFNLGTVRLKIISIDYDLRIKEGEPPDRASVRVLRQACLQEASIFPALMIRGGEPIIISFNPSQPVYIGRATDCEVRLDSTEISNKHARMGYESGKFWIEDLGSTNGTFLAGQQIAGRVDLEPGVPVTLGRRYSLLGVTTHEELLEAGKIASESIPRPSARKYPVLLSTSEIARPARMVLPIDSPIEIGRDPGSDMWLGAPHVSRKHCEVTLDKTGNVILVDFSTNGTGCNDGILKNGESLKLKNEPAVLDFGGDITVAVCFDNDQETSYLSVGGAPTAFTTGVEQEDLLPTGSFDGITEANRRDTLTGITFFGLNDTLSGTGLFSQYWYVFKSLSFGTKFLLFIAMTGLLAIVLILLGALKTLIF